MKETFELRKPIMINNKEVKELTYDFEEIDCNAFALACTYADAKSLVATQQGRPSAAIMEQNSNMHMYLAMMAILAINPAYDITDLERVKGYDIIALTSLGRNFIAGRSEAPLNQNSSEELSEATPGSTTPELEK